MPDVWITSDSHFGHLGIYHFKTYELWENRHLEPTCYVRPEFKNYLDGDDYMMTMWNQNVKPDDKVIFGGDLLFTNNEEYWKKLKLLHGKKTLILGNHDNFQMSKYQSIFKHIYSYKDLTSIFGQRVIFTHCPTHMESFYPVKDAINLHGHIHEKVVRWPFGEPDNRYINLSVELTKYEPVNVDTIADWIKTGFNPIQQRFALEHPKRPLNPSLEL